MGAVLCPARCFAASLPSTHQMPVASSPLSGDNQKCCQMSPVEQNHPCFKQTMRSCRWDCRGGNGTPVFLNPPLIVFQMLFQLPYGRGPQMWPHYSIIWELVRNGHSEAPSPECLNQKFEGWGLLAIRVLTSPSGSLVLGEV